MKQETQVLIILLLIIGATITYLEYQRPEIGDPVLDIMKDGKYSKAPELRGISGYLNTDGNEIKIADYKGKVVLIDFWTYTCINCIRTLPHLVAWDEKYRDKGLVIIGVHTPEFAFEKKKKNVQDAIDQYNIEYAVVQDNDYDTWNAYANRYWPHKFLIDSEGFIRYDKIGEGGYDETEREIQKLLAELGEDVSTVKDSDIADQTPGFQLDRTPELYAGFKFALPRLQNIGNDGGLKPGETIEYALPEIENRHQIYLDGTWKSNEDNLQSTTAGKVVLDFAAANANIVADALEDPTRMEVFVDGEYISKAHAGSDVQFEDGKAFVLMDQPRLYNIYNAEHERHVLKLVVEKDFTFNAFTFG